MKIATIGITLSMTSLGVLTADDVVQDKHPQQDAGELIKHLELLEKEVKKQLLKSRESVKTKKDFFFHWDGKKCPVPVGNIIKFENGETQYRYRCPYFHICVVEKSSYLHLTISLYPELGCVFKMEIATKAL